MTTTPNKAVLQEHSAAFNRTLEIVDDQGARLRRKSREVAKLRHALKRVMLELCVVTGQPRVGKAMKIAHDALWRDDDE